VRIFVGIDDTDTAESDRGTGKVARWLENVLPSTFHLWGVVRHQLLMDAAIPFTTHNSSACAVVELDDIQLLDTLISTAVDHVLRNFIPGSDPGLCVIPEGHSSLSELISFGLLCTKRVVTQAEALRAASGDHLSGHGGTNDGIIGAAAAVGLTAYGWGGRFIEFGRLRDFPEKVRVTDVQKTGIAVVSIDRDAQVPLSEDVIDTKGWLRPRLWGGRPVLPVIPRDKTQWETLEERKKRVREKGGA
jgi:hypothetical protein